MSERELAEAVEKLVREMELCRKTYVGLWIPLTIGLFVILTRLAGFW